MPSTQDFLDVEDVLNDLVLLRDGSVCLILEVTAVNFGLFSEKEQEATIYAYAQLLNSLTYSIQIVIVSKRKDISDYLNQLDERLLQTPSPQLKEQLTKYRDFIKAIVRQGNVLDKKFYISIPFSSLELGSVSALTSLTNRTPKLSRPKEEIIERASINLVPKRDHLIRLLNRIGLHAKQLTSPDILQLFFDLHNPDQYGTKVNLPLSNPSPPSHEPPVSA